MKEIRDALFLSVSKNSRHRLTIFSGHDTVIAPVLAALGVYRQAGLCVWPPYASRIVFEVYVRKSKLRGGESGTEIAFEEVQARNEAMIRVLYNGQDVTKMITSCKDMIGYKYPIVTPVFLCDYPSCSQRAYCKSCAIIQTKKILKEREIKSKIPDCVACMDSQSTHLAFPCGHLCICSKCVERLEQQKCPVCNQFVTKFAKVYT